MMSPAKPAKTDTTQPDVRKEFAQERELKHPENDVQAELHYFCRPVVGPGHFVQTDKNGWNRRKPADAANRFRK